MKISGKNSVGGILKIILQIFFIGGIAFLILLPVVLMLLGKHLNAFAYVLYPNGICFLVFVKQFIELFDLLKENNPFCSDTVKRMKIAGRASGIITIILGAETIFNIFVIKDEMFSAFILGGVAILFLGISIALYILSELFKQATEYKEENDLTV